MTERYEFNANDHDLLRAAETMLKKVAAVETTRPAELVSIAKLQHVLSVLPRVTSGVEVSVSVVCPRRTFGDIETRHWWEVAVEDGRLVISSGGHFYRPSTGGDTFTTMSWTAVPEEPAEVDDYRESLWMVPDVGSFQEGVASINFASGGYSVEVNDSDNPLLEESEVTEDGEVDDEGDEEREDENDGEPEPGTDEDTPRNWSITSVDAVEERLASMVDPDQVDANEPAHASSVQNCDFCGCDLERHGLFVDGRLRCDLMWGNLCGACFASRGEGIGWGKGQLYARQADGSWRMVAGWKCTRITILDGPQGRYEIDPKDWCTILLTLEDCGWRPEQSRLAYLASDVVVSDLDSMNLARAADNFLESVADNPAIMARHPNLDKLAEVVSFCESGGFRILSS